MSATHKLLRFGVFELNLSTEELRKDGMPIKLSPQPFQLLALLASHAGQIVTREEIHKQLWDDDTFVDFEQGMNKCIKQIRTVLSDNADHPIYVETLPRRGYRFLAPVTSKSIEAPLPRVTASASGVQTRFDLTNAAQAMESTSAVASRTADPILSAAATAAVDLAPAAVAALATAPAPSTAVVEVQAIKPVRGVTRSPLAWAALAVLVLVGVVLYWRSQNAHALTERDTIVLADFDNSTGAAVFDSTLKEALTANLEQSPFLNVLPAQKVREQLRFMGQSPDAPLKEDAARQVCQRTGSKAMLLGSIASLGNSYAIYLRAENCNTGDPLATVQGQAESREKVLKTLNVAASSLRSKLGESLASVQKYDIPIEQATTPSLDALKAYSLGLKSQDREGGEEAIPFYKRAIELDSNFAMAYSRLGSIYNNLNEPDLSAENSSKAFEFRDRTSEKEKLLITGNYYRDVSGDLPKAIEALTVLTQTYPREIDPHITLSAIYSYLGRYSDGLSEELEGYRLDASNGSIYANLAGFYIALDRYNDAKKVLADAQARKLGNEYLISNYYLLAFLTNDEKELKRQADIAKGDAGLENQMLWLQSDTQAYFGHIEAARRYTLQARESALRAGRKSTALTWQLDGALHEAEVGNSARGLQEASTSLGGASDKNQQVLSALAIARSGGDPKRVRALADGLSKQFPDDTVIQSYWLPTIRAAVELAQNNPSEAIRLLQAAESYELGSPPPWVGPLYPLYLRGLAYLKANQGDKAAAEFQKILSHRGIGQNFLLSSLAYLQLGRAQVIDGKRDAAVKTYQSFLALWKDADSDLPILMQAKDEYARLR